MVPPRWSFALLSVALSIAYVGAATASLVPAVDEAESIEIAGCTIDENLAGAYTYLVVDCLGFCYRIVQGTGPAEPLRAVPCKGSTTIS
ncbi:MAG: hypothetical protein ACPGQL_07920 [Thermoplasmatota archaeon]